MPGTGLQPAAIAITFTFPAVSLCIVAARYYRKITERTFGGDDLILGFAMALAIAYCFVDYSYIKLGQVGFHEEDVVRLGPADFTKMMKLLYVESIIYNPILCLVKASFLWTLMRLRSPRIWVNRALWFIQIINGIYVVGSTLASIFACDPIKAKWDMQAAQTAKCYDIVAYVVSSISIVLFTDLLVLAIPTWIIYDLHMPLVRKIITISFMSLGLAVTAIGAVRLKWMIDLFVYRRNPSYSVSQTYSTMESNLAIVGACGPTVKWMLSRCIPWLERGGKSSNRYYNYNNRNNYNMGSSGISKGRRRMYTSNPSDGTFLSMTRPDDDPLYTRRDQETVELRDAPQWRHRHQESYVEVDDGIDPLKDEAGKPGILKTVEWDVASGHRRSPLSPVPVHKLNKNKSDTRLAVRPTDVL